MKQLTDQGFVDVSEEYIAHHGVMGMRWGVRRYQKEDGTRTSEGKRHRGIIEDYKEAKAKNERNIASYQKRYGLSRRQAKKLNRNNNILKGAAMSIKADQDAAKKTKSKLAKKIYAHDVKKLMKYGIKAGNKAERIKKIGTYKKSGMSGSDARKTYNAEIKSRIAKNLQKEVISEQRKAKTNIGKAIWKPDVKIYGAASEHYANKAKKIKKKYK